MSDNVATTTKEPGTDQMNAQPMATGEPAAPVADAAVRLRLRYPPPRVPRPVVVAVVGVCVLAALGWLVWAAALHSRPAVAGQVAAYTVVSDSRIDVTMTVDRRDPSVPVSCLLVAQASDFERVAEQKIGVEARPERVVNVTVSLTTLRRATSASVKECTAAR